ncbi:hypothetical protein BRC77_03195 [Halobacteriales archaeon QH_8_64_26]|nr:MAG: hypothetical protein BRC77_03195 [Halobacteriales archaeon QH_8_64_26]
MDERIGTSLHTGLLIAVLGVLAWATGFPALFPSLGPSAFVLARVPNGEVSKPRRVLGAHAIGVVAGLLAYQAFASGLVVTQSVLPFSTTSMLLAASGVASIVLTVAGMLFFECSHPPACATTMSGRVRRASGSRGQGSSPRGSRSRSPGPRRETARERRPGRYPRFDSQDLPVSAPRSTFRSSPAVLVWP